MRTQATAVAVFNREAAPQDEVDLDCDLASNDAYIGPA